MSGQQERPIQGQPRQGEPTYSVAGGPAEHHPWSQPIINIHYPQLPNITHSSEQRARRTSRWPGGVALVALTAVALGGGLIANDKAGNPLHLPRPFGASASQDPAEGLAKTPPTDTESEKAIKVNVETAKDAAEKWGGKASEWTKHTKDANGKPLEGVVAWTFKGDDRSVALGRDSQGNDGTLAGTFGTFYLETDNYKSIDVLTGKPVTTHKDVVVFNGNNIAATIPATAGTIWVPTEAKTPSEITKMAEFHLGQMITIEANDPEQVGIRPIPAGICIPEATQADRLIAKDIVTPQDAADRWGGKASEWTKHTQQADGTPLTEVIAWTFNGDGRSISLGRDIYGNDGTLAGTFGTFYLETNNYKSIDVLTGEPVTTHKEVFVFNGDNIAATLPATAGTIWVPIHRETPTQITERAEFHLGQMIGIEANDPEQVGIRPIPAGICIPTVS